MRTSSDQGQAPGGAWLANLHGSFVHGLLLCLVFVCALGACSGGDLGVSPPTAPAQIGNGTASTRAEVPPAQAARRGAAVGPVAMRLIPVEVRAESDGPSDPWAAVDGNLERAVETHGVPAMMTLRFGGIQRIEALTVHGPLDGSLTLLREVGGHDVEVPGATDITLRSDGWRRFVFAAPVDAETLRVRWAPATSNARLEEIEFWGTGAHRAVVPHELIVDRLLQGHHDVGVSIASTPEELSISKPEERRPGAGEFSLSVDGEPRRWARAFLVYEIRGLAHWTEARRAINGNQFVGGHRPLIGADGGLQVEEIDPSQLHRGVNTVRFASVDDRDPVGYRVRDLRLVGVEADVLASAQLSDNARALGDGDLETALEARPSRALAQQNNPTWRFATLTAVHEVDLMVTRAWSGAAEIQFDRDGLVERRTLPTHSLGVGWHRFPIDPPVALASRVSLVLQASGEQIGRIAEVSLATSAESTPDAPRLVITWPRHGECVGGEALVQGFVTHPTQRVANAAMTIDEVAAGSVRDDGSFELTAAASAGRVLRVGAVLEDGTRIAERVAFDTCADAPQAPIQSGLLQSARIDDVGAPFGQWVRAGRAASIEYGDVKLDIPAGAVDRDVRITIRPLTTAQVPTLDSGMTNVAPEGKGFRLGPHGMRFRRPIRLTLPYGVTNIPPGMTDADVGVFFHNEALGRWQMVPRVRGERGARVVASSDHFTDFVAATVAAPETPQAASFNPNAMRGLDPGDPGAGITTIAAPEANSSGSASLSYPLEVPPGRRGMQPHLAISYDSELPNGWLGVGWNLELPKVEIDTRFGVPLYDGVNDRYVLNGAALVVEGIDGEGCTLYKRRIEGAFDRIRRCGTGPTDFLWSVTDRGGTVFTYGASSSSRLADHRTGNIFRWMLQNVTDTFGNRINYSYVSDSGVMASPSSVPGEPWTQLYPNAIYYTSHVSGSSEDLPPHYSVSFESSPGRSDVVSSARSGFDIRTRRRLDRVVIKEGTTIIREYRLHYTNGDFDKSLLHDVELWGVGGTTRLYGHTFAYYAAPRDGAANIRMGDPAVWATGLDDDDRVDSSSNVGSGFNAFIGIGPTVCDPHVGGGVHVSESSSTSHYSMADVNGDGIPDLVSTDGRIRLGKLTSPSGSTGAYQATTAQSPAEISTNSDVSLEATIAGHVWSEAAGAGADFAWNWNTQSRLFTDVNGDGRVDLIRGPLPVGAGLHALDVYLNPFGQMRSGFGVGTSLTADYQLGGFVPLPQQRTVSTSTADRLRGLFRPIDTVLRWVSPIRGKIVIRGYVKRRGPLGNEEEGTDGIRASIYRAQGIGALAPTTTLLWTHEIVAGSFETCTPASFNTCGTGLTVANVDVGDRFYFRVSGLDDPRGDTTEWDPEIQIVDFDPTELPCDPGYAQSCMRVPASEVVHDYRLSTDFRLADPDTSGWTAPVNGTVTIQGELEHPATGAGMFLSVFRRHREWSGALPRYGDPTWQPTRSDIEQMIADNQSGTLQLIQGVPIASAEVLPSSTPFHVYFPGIAVEQGDQLVFSIRMYDRSDPLPIRFTPEVRYSSVQLWSPEAPWSSAVVSVGGCSLDAATNVRFCNLVPPVGALTRLPESFISRRAFPAISERDASLPRRDIFMGGWAFIPGPSWTSPPVNQPWRLWGFAAWTDDPAVTFAESEMGYGEMARHEVTRQLDRLEAGEPFQGPRLVPMVEQWASSPLGNPGSERIVDDVTGDLWVSLGSDTYIGAGMMRPGRMGNAILTSDNRIVVSGRGGQRASNAPGLRQSSGENHGPSVTIPLLSFGENDGISDGELEFIDINGDRLPDSVRIDGVQYQNGAEHTFTTPHPMPFAFSSLRHTRTTTYRSNLGLGSAAAALAGRNTGGGRHNSTAPSLPSFGITNSTSHTDVDFADINGDGLVDHVRFLEEGGQFWIDYQLNLGYRLGEVSRIAAPSLGPNYHDLSASAQSQTSNTVSLQFGYAGIGGGPATTTNASLSRLIDMNGDGLVDRVFKLSDDTFFRVQLNRGGDFDIARPWMIGSWPAGVAPSNDALSLSSSLSGNVGAGVPLKVPLVFVCLVAELSANLNGGRTTTTLDLHDIDGDGHVDHVLRAGDSVYVRRNETGQSNLLRRVEQPLGGSFALTYAREGNRVGTASDGSGTQADMPHNQWVLSSVVRNDGRSHDHTHSFEYFGSGYYDRGERESYGYAHVRVRREDGSSVDTRYHNQDYYRKGRAWEEVEADAAGIPLRRKVTTWEAPTGSPTSFFPAMTREETFWYDGVSTAAIASTRKDSAYDAWGDVTHVTDFGDAGTADDVDYTIGYSRDFARWVFRASSVEARRGTELLRRRTSSFRTDGALQSLTEWVTGGRNPATGALYSADPATWTYDYDVYGNLFKATDPSGFSLQYGYDPVTFTHRASTTDSFGYSSSVDTDLRFGAPHETVDVNGNHQRVVYDEFGRVSEVYAPDDVASTDPTVRYEYALPSGTATVFPTWVRVRNKDSTRPLDPVDTVVFVDGFHRVIQTKHDIEVDAGSGGTSVGMSVSGAVTFDNRGRVQRVGQGIFDSAADTSFVSVAESNASVTAYDVLSRIVSVTAPDGTVTSTSYGAEALDGMVRLTTTVTDPLSRSRTNFSNLHGETVAVREHNTIAGTLRTLLTRYAYDPLGRLTQVTDANGNLTTATYDSRGLMVALDNPDTGRAEYRYTLAGDLGVTETPRLRADGEVIRYVRTWHRLDRVEYPDGPPTTHSYGLPGAGYNQAGRIVETSDASGTRRFRYGRLGEVVWSQHKLNAIGSTPNIDGTMEYAYDSFGRMQTLRYPDGALLTYKYDVGANLRRVSAERGANAWTYIDRITYDQFGQRASIRYGNGIETRYAYHPQTRRLTGADSDTLGGAALQRLRYNYNAVGNIIWRDNVVPSPGPLNGTTYQTLYYDDLDQLTAGYGTMYRGNQVRNFTLSLAYDAIGNITQKAQNDVIYTTPTWASETQSQTTYAWSYVYGGSRPHAPSTVGSRAFSYDPDGNQTGWSDSAAGTSRTLVWDSQDRVQSIATGSSTVHFVYDSDGRRTHKQSNSGTTQYLNAFVSVRNGVTATRHVFAGDQRIASTVLPEGMTGPSQLHYYYHTDHLQSAQFVTDGGGAITEHYEYFPFGEPWVDESASSERLPYRFSAKELDEETGLYDFGVRYYDPRQSQWASPDPVLGRLISERSDELRSANLSLYTYCWNSPLTLRDPNGENPLFWAAVVVVGVGAMTPSNVPTPYDARLPISLHETARDYLAMRALGRGLGAGGRWVASRPLLRPVVQRAESAFWRAQERYQNASSAVRRAIGGETEPMVQGPYSAVPRATLERAAASQGPTERIYTNLSEVPQGGRGLAAAGGTNGRALAQAAGDARGEGDLYVANVPVALMTELRVSGLVRESQTLMGGAVATEVHFTADGATWVARFFQRVPE